jgi:biopolymer transport protein ExbB
MEVHAIADLAGVGARYVLYLLLGLSVMQVAIIIERAVMMWRSRARRPIAMLLRQATLSDDYTALAEALARSNALAERALCAAAGRAADGPDAAQEVAIARIGEERLLLERRLAFLGTLGNNAPFIGLFGTVLGIIRAIADLAGSTGAAAATSRVVLGGIAEALVLTGAGLMVALPAVVAFNFFQRIIRLRVGAAERLIAELRAGLLGARYRQRGLLAA